MRRPKKGRRARGSGCTFLHGRSRWIKYRDAQGKVVRENLGMVDEPTALNALQKRLDQREQGHLPVTSGRVRLDDLHAMLKAHYQAQRLASWMGAASAWKHLDRLLGEKLVAQINASDLDLYVATRQEEEAKDATIQRELAMLKKAFALAIRAGKLDRRPAFPTLSIGDSNARQGFFEADQVEAVIRHLPEDFADVTRFGYASGWRKSEILGLRWKNVDLKAGTVRLDPGTTKNKDGRVHPMSAETKVLFERRHAQDQAHGRIGGWVFHEDGEPIGEDSFRRAWHRACAACGVQRLFHDLRRSFVRRCELAGIPRSIATKLSGHRSEQVYRRYAIVAESDLSDAITKMAAMENGHKSGHKAG